MWALLLGRAVGPGGFVVARGGSDILEFLPWYTYFLLHIASGGLSVVMCFWRVAIGAFCGDFEFFAGVA